MTVSIEHKWYSFDKLASFNGTINMACGARGIGKTYGAKVRAVKRFIKYGEMFIYLRRYKTELVSRHTFFADFQHLFEDKWDFRVNGHEAQIAPVETRGEKKREWRTMGYFIALSTAQTTKSVAYPKVTTVIFDEFIIEKGAYHYLPDETTVLINFYSTVDRGQDKTKFYMLSNAVSINNPYFIEWDIKPDTEKEFVIRKRGFVVCHFPESEEFQNSMYQTAFGKFIEGSAYADYALGNEFADANVNLVSLKDSKAKYAFSVETSKGVFSVWHNIFTGDYYVQKKLPKEQTVLTLVPERMASDRIYITFSDKPLANLRTAFRQARVWFDNAHTRNIFTEIFKR